MAFGAATLTGWIVLAVLTVCLGLVLVHVLMPVHGLARADEHLNDWLAAHRSGRLNTLSEVGSHIGDVPAIPAIVAIAVATAAILRRFRVAAFLTAAIVVEVATYRVASLLVHRDRPSVPRLDVLPANESFPSGHTAAAVAVYASLALVISSWTPRRWVAALAWTLAVLLPLAVAASRMYRGMHHLSDVASGALVGTGALLVALLAVRACGAAKDARDGQALRLPAREVGKTREVRA
ncbi:MAG TPA: phosphatase PAP2 family protein [Miltoncostaeaceae bacterium]|nr:phosphatase PAP2 family protein [Miltoncostaeaceae bacterium]